MKVLLVSSEFPPYGSGIASAVRSIRTHMLRMGAKVNVLSSGWADININSKLNSVPGLIGLISFWERAADYLAKRADEYDIVWLHSPLLIDARKLRRASKIMVTIHTTYYGFYQAYKKHAICRLLPYYFAASKLENRFLKEISLMPNTNVTAVSPSVAEEAKKNGLAYLPDFVPNGLETNNLACLNETDKWLPLYKEHALQFGREEKILVYIGRLTEQKQPLLLVNFFKALSSIRSDANLIIVGNGNLLSKTRKKTAKLAKAHVLGYIPRKAVLNLLSRASIYISLSCYEGLPLATIEAASFGLPLILSDIPAHRWIIESGIGYGRTLNSRKPNYTEIPEFIENCVSTRKEFREPLLEKYTWNKVINQYLTLWNK